MRAQTDMTHPHHTIIQISLLKKMLDSNIVTSWDFYVWKSTWIRTIHQRTDGQTAENDDWMKESQRKNLWYFLAQVTLASGSLVFVQAWWGSRSALHLIRKHAAETLLVSRDDGALCLGVIKGRCFVNTVTGWKAAESKRGRVIMKSQVE